MLVASATALALAFIVVVGASAQSTNVVITRAEAQGAHPSVSWTLAPGWCSNVVNVARSPQTGSDGSFFSENVIDGGVLGRASQRPARSPHSDRHTRGLLREDSQTSWLSSSASLDNPGTYYVQVQAVQCDFGAGPEWSATGGWAAKHSAQDPYPNR